MAAPWDKIFSKYDRNDLAFLNAFLRKLYKSIYGARDQPEDLSYFASLACIIAVTFRENGINLTSLTVQIEPPSRADTDALMLALRALDEMIEKLMEFIGQVADTDPKVEDSLAMMQAMFIWKGCLSAINTPPTAWTDGQVCALSAFWILTTVDSADVVKRVRNNAFASFRFNSDVRGAIQEADWPPRGLVDLYSKNRDLLEKKSGAILGNNR